MTALRSALLVLCAVLAGCQAAHAEGAAAKAELGKLAPEFTLTDLDGKQHKLSQSRGKIVVLEWFNPECPFVKSAHGKGPLKDMAQRRMNEQVEWLSINSSAVGKQGNGVERNKAGTVEFGMKNALLLDETGKVGHAYGAEKTPHIFIVNPSGILVYRGGLDNAPMGVVDDTRPRPKDAPSGTLVPYVENALDALLAKKPIVLNDTPAYGCSVKYGD